MVAPGRQSVAPKRNPATIRPQYQEKARPAPSSPPNDQPADFSPPARIRAPRPAICRKPCRAPAQNGQVLEKNGSRKKHPEAPGNGRRKSGISSPLGCTPGTKTHRDQTGNCFAQCQPVMNSVRASAFQGDPGVKAPSRDTNNASHRAGADCAWRFHAGTRNRPSRGAREPGSFSAAVLSPVTAAEGQSAAVEEVGIGVGHGK